MYRHTMNDSLFEVRDKMEHLFQGDIDIPRLVTALQIEAGVKIDPQDT